MCSCDEYLSRNGCVSFQLLVCSCDEYLSRNGYISLLLLLIYKCVPEMSISLALDTLVSYYLCVHAMSISLAMDTLVSYYQCDVYAISISCNKYVSW